MVSVQCVFCWIQINSRNNATGILTTEIQLNVIVLQDLPSYVNFDPNFFILLFKNKFRFSVR